MKKLILISALAAILGTQVQADPAVYQDNILTIPQGILIKPDEGQYYRNIVLEPAGEGTWRLAAAVRSHLAVVEEVDVLVDPADSSVVDVTINGYKSVPCVELEPLGITRSGNTFYVVIAETEMGPAESCIAVIDPFTLNVELDTSGLEAGEYVVNVNGVEEEFELAP